MQCCGSVQARGFRWIETDTGDHHGDAADEQANDRAQSRVTDPLHVTFGRRDPASTPHQGQICEDRVEVAATVCSLIGWLDRCPLAPQQRRASGHFLTSHVGHGVDMSHAAKCSDLLEPVSANGAVARSEASQSEMGGISMFALSPLGRRHMHLRGKDTSKMRGVVEAAGKSNFSN